MGLDKDINFRKFVLEKSDNPFIEVMKVATEARKRAEENAGGFMDSQAITWVVQGIEPTYRGTKHTRLSYEENELKETLCYIDDKEVRKAVKLSFYVSKARNDLIYRYGSIEDEPRKARVRVATRLLWYKLK